MSEPKTWGSGSGTTDLFLVEARSSVGHPLTHGGMTLDGEWRRVTFASGETGIPILAHVPGARECQLLNYEAAVAALHWFLALPTGELPFPGIGVQARLVRVKLTYHYDTVETGVGSVVDHYDQKRAVPFTARVAEEASNA